MTEIARPYQIPLACAHQGCFALGAHSVKIRFAYHEAWVSLCDIHYEATKKWLTRFAWSEQEKP